jgi:hypothetical protein
MQHALARTGLWLTVALLAASCNGGTSTGDPGGVDAGEVDPGEVDGGITPACALDGGGQSSDPPLAQAGPDQTIYLTETSTVTLDGSASSGASAQWTEVSTDYPSGATITSPSCGATTVTGLPQGVWYFELAVTRAGMTARDTVMIIVDHDPPPPGAVYVRRLEMDNPAIYDYINDRSDTSQLEGSPDGVTTAEGEYFFDRSRSNSMLIDDQHGKFYSTIEDGYGWQSDPSYARAEGSWGSSYTLAVATTYVIEWKGYYPQDFSYLEENQATGALFQVHPNDDGSPGYGIAALYGYDGGNHSRGAPGVYGLYFTDDQAPPNFFLVEDLHDMVNQTHTIRLTVREGPAGQGAFLKFEVDGVMKYHRDTGDVGRDWGHSYLKFATVYDWANAIVDPANTTRGRRFSLVTESYKLYRLP